MRKAMQAMTPEQIQKMVEEQYRQLREWIREQRVRDAAPSQRGE